MSSISNVSKIKNLAILKASGHSNIIPRTSCYPAWITALSKFAYIVIEGKSGDLFGDGKWRKPRDFWHPLIDKLDSGQVNQIIEKAFRKHKIKFIRVY